MGKKKTDRKMARGQIDALEKIIEAEAGKSSRPISGNDSVLILNLPAFRTDGPMTRSVKAISSLVLTPKVGVRGKRITSPKKSILPASLSLVFPKPLKPPKANPFQLSFKLFVGRDWLLVV